MHAPMIPNTTPTARKILPTSLSEEMCKRKIPSRIQCGYPDYHLKLMS